MAAATLALAGCPPAKPEVALPPASGAIAAEVLGTVAARDPRELLVDGDRLYVGDGDGLAVFDVGDPAAPALLGRALARPVDALAVAGARAYTIDIGGSGLLAELDVGGGAPMLLREVASPTFTFGGLAARPGLVWHAVGSSPPSRLYRDVGGAPCDAPDRERGAMDVWLTARWAFETVHFDDLAGDGLDGNGAYGLVSFAVDDAGAGCPRARAADTFFFATHARNRSRFERGSASDLQVAAIDDGATLYVTGEQQVRRLAVAADGALREEAALDLPEALSVAADVDDRARPVIAVGTGALQLVDDEGGRLELAATVAPPGVIRAVAFAGDGGHLYAASDEAGVVIVRYRRVAR
jgi:hypothetical protein